MMPRGYRFIFFDQDEAEAAAAFLLHLMSDEIAISEAHLLLAVSTHTYVEVWLAGTCIHIEHSSDAHRNRSGPRQDARREATGTKRS